MDYLHTNASISIGLFNARPRQKHLNSLVLSLETWRDQSSREVRGRKALNGCRRVDLTVVYEALSMIVNDKWNTRAWILQEAFASSGNMMLLFPRLENVDVAHWLLICHKLSQSELAIQLDVIQRCLETCYQLMQPLISQVLQDRLIKLSRRIGGRKEKHLLGQRKDIQTTVKRFQFFHPRQQNHQSTYWVNNLKPRRVCNAATSL